MYISKKYKEEQELFFKGIQQAHGGNFDKYFKNYLEWKIKEISKGYKAIQTDEDPSTTKANVAKINGAVLALEDVLRRLP